MMPRRERQSARSLRGIHGGTPLLRLFALSPVTRTAAGARAWPGGFVRSDDAPTGKAVREILEGHPRRNPVVAVVRAQSCHQDGGGRAGVARRLRPIG